MKRRQPSDGSTPSLGRAGDASVTITVGLLVNPVAGLGGAAGLAGSDGVDVQREAASRGAVSHATERASTALRLIRPLFTGYDEVRDGAPDAPIGTTGRGEAAAELLVAPGPMGETAAAAADVNVRTLPASIESPTSAADTTACAAAFVDAGVDLLLFAGGDGTAADIARGCGERIAVLGIPSGVKMYSGCFAVSPGAAAGIVRRFVAAASAAADARGGRVMAHVAGPRTATVEVVDLDEETLRDGLVRPRLTASLRIPAAPAVQSRKAPTTGDAAAQVEAVAAAAAGVLADGIPTAVGPGGTTAAVMSRLGLSGTLLGVDIVRVRGENGGGATLLAAGVSEPELFDCAANGPLRVMVSVIGGQGFVFGRGNQQFSPRVLRAVGARNIVILAPEAKLAALGGRPLLVDTGDATLDSELAGYRRVLTGPSQWAMYPVGEVPGGKPKEDGT